MWHFGHPILCFLSCRSPITTAATTNILRNMSKTKSKSKNKDAKSSNSGGINQQPVAIAATERITLEIKVRPNAGQTSIEQVVYQNDSLIDLQMKVKEPPENNEANRAIVKFLSKLLSIDSSQVNLISGAKSKNKTFSIQDWRPAMLTKLQQSAQ